MRRRATSELLRKSAEAMNDSSLLKSLRAEIRHEFSSASKNRYQNVEAGSCGDFSIAWDSSSSRDILLLKKQKSGEEVAVSAILGPESRDDGRFPWDLDMKVCIKKPRLRSILQFDCLVQSISESSSDFEICGAYYLPLAASLGPSSYRGPLFSELDSRLQLALKSYLEDKGIGCNLTNFLLLHLHRKEQNQYLDWLQKTKKIVFGGE